MKHSKAILFLFAILLLNFQCEDDDIQLPPTDCDRFAVVDSNAYQNANSDFFNINSAEIEGDCLSIEISASGCNGETWILQLFSSEGVMESLPVQRNIRAVLINDEACLAVFTKTFTFDLRDLQVEGEQQVSFNLLDYSEPILYSY
ncbi:hypothetical protein [Winogradskyella tangerina]|uniref:hypothetical protein n=1 Tax=Winogradskyella tangerina TaxID=2023240 RepID=UPI000DBE5E65|nr:hypothetical protein [Winogradskyella tangerina]